MKVAAERGIPPMRPLFFGFPDDTRAAAVADQFLFGPDLLVAPITVYRGRERRVYLPAAQPRELAAAELGQDGVQSSGW